MAHVGMAVVAIPARDEEGCIETCLLALDRQQHLPDRVILLLNNCTDGTEARASRLASSLHFPLDIVSVELPPLQASAGHARRLAVGAALDCCAADDVILTTDADTTMPVDWIQLNLTAILGGADIVCGRAVIDPIDALRVPLTLQADDDLECQLDGLIDAIAWNLDPEGYDPPPRHTEASGASLAFTARVCREVGGIPELESGEDRAFVRALRERDAVIRHDPSITVVVSGRIQGRARNGMADAIRRRMVKQDEFTDERIEPPEDATRRYRLRQQVRLGWRGATVPDLASPLAISPLEVLNALSLPFFGAAWAMIEAKSPVLQRRRVRFVDLPDEIAIARLILEGF
jgi:hypothetical protein